MKKQKARCYETIQFRSGVAEVQEFYKFKDQLELWLEEPPTLDEQVETFAQTLSQTTSLRAKLAPENFEHTPY